MPGAVLRVSGSKSSVTRFLGLTIWRPLSTYWKGEPRFKGSRRTSKVNGFNINLSNASGRHLQTQVRDVTLFLHRHGAEFRRLKKLKIHGTVDFGVEAEHPNGPEFYRFPDTLIAELARYGLDLEVSYYGVPPQ
jgi:hypothetical protein